MNITGIEDKEKSRKEKARKAVALAMQNRWKEAALVNRQILDDFPRDLEASNRLGKSLSELGRNKEAKKAFQKALEIAPHNSIAKKNLDRLNRIGDTTPRPTFKINATRQVFIEESGNTGVTTLVSLATPDILLKLSPGHPVNLQLDGGRLKVTAASEDYVGHVEPRLASRLLRLIKGGNQYEATITSVAEQELTIIIREISKHPSQKHIVSFPMRDNRNYPIYVTPNQITDYHRGSEDPGEGMAPIKDWSNDDTEPGDDDAFSPVFDRIINGPGEDLLSDATEEY